MSEAEKRVSDLGESGLLDRVALGFGEAPAGEVWGGDDAAVVPAPRGDLLFAIDTLVESIDFDLAYCSGADIGWKALAANVSDIAAMGGRSSSAVVSLSLPSDASVALVDDLVGGLAAAGRRWEVNVVGGDISRGAQVSLSVAIVGAPPGPVVLRSGAHIGDVICVTGALGGAAGGLALLRSGFPAAPLQPELERLRARQLRPQARAAEGAALAPYATAMIDVSDGLAVDLDNLLSASGTGCEVDTACVPVDPDLIAAQNVLADGPLHLAITGGEDYELLFTIPEEKLEDARAALGSPNAAVTRIGSVTRGDKKLGDTPLRKWKELGWEHLRGP